MKKKSFFFAQTLRFFLELLLISLSFSLRPIWPIFRNIANIQPKNWLFLQYFHLNLVFPQHTLQCILSHFYRGQFLQLFCYFEILLKPRGIGFFQMVQKQPALNGNEYLTPYTLLFCCILLLKPIAIILLQCPLEIAAPQPIATSTNPCYVPPNHKSNMTTSKFSPHVVNSNRSRSLFSVRGRCSQYSMYKNLPLSNLTKDPW